MRVGTVVDDIEKGLLAKFQVPKSKNAFWRFFWPKTNFRLFFITFGSIGRPVFDVIFFVWVNCELGRSKTKIYHS